MSLLRFKKRFLGFFLGIAYDVDRFKKEGLQGSSAHLGHLKSPAECIYCSQGARNASTHSRLVRYLQSVAREPCDVQTNYAKKYNKRTVDAGWILRCVLNRLLLGKILYILSG